jgi:hypothetical protein
VRDLLQVTQNRGYTVLLIMLTFPFCTPIPLPGVSLPFGLVIALIGFRLALGQKPWLPERLLNQRLPAMFFPRALAATRRLISWLEYLLKPRHGHILRWRVVRQSMGVMILVCGLLQILPFPIPFSNGLPAFTVLLLASAMLEEDGYFAIAGGFCFLLTVAFFGSLLWGGSEVVSWMQDLLGSLFHRTGNEDM